MTSASTNVSCAKLTNWFSFRFVSFRFGDHLDGMHEIRTLAYNFLVLGAISFVAMWGQAILLELAATQMTHELQFKWFQALMRQDMAYFDLQDVSGAATIISTNGAKYKKYVPVHTHTHMDTHGHFVSFRFFEVFSPFGNQPSDFSLSLSLTLSLSCRVV